MKLYYFSYFIRKKSTQEKFNYNISQLIRAYCHSKNVALKSSFKSGDEKLYLTKVAGYQNTYYFLKTSDDDLLKRINETNFLVGDIKDNLQDSEKLAFTSHFQLAVDRAILAIASGIGCPRFDALVDYVNRLFTKSGLDDYEIELIALSAEATKKDLLEMELVNSVYIDIDADNGIGKTIANELFGNNTAGLGNFKVKVESATGNMKNAFKSIVNKKDKSGILKIGAKAKHDEFKGILMEYWLDNENVLADKINPRAKAKSIADQIGEKIDTNQNVINLYKLFLNNQVNLKSGDEQALKLAETQAFFDEIEMK